MSSSAKSSRRPGFGAHRGSTNPKITIIWDTSVDSAFSQLPVSPRLNDMYFDCSVNPFELYIYNPSDVWQKVTVI